MIEHLLLLASLATPPPDSGAVADTVATSRRVVPVRGVLVEGDRALGEARRRAPTAFVSERRAGDTGRAIETLGDLLDMDPGARITRYGGLGAFSTVSLRGAPPAHVAVVLDGVPLGSAAHSIADLSSVPMAAIEKVQVYRSLAPPSLGAPSPGGAVALRVRDDARLAEARLARGSFASTEARGAFARRVGPVSALALAGYLGSRGDFRYHDDNGTPQNATDDSVVARLNNRLDAWNALARLGTTVAGVRATLRGEAFHRAQGVPGLGAVQTPHPRLAFERSALVAELARPAGRREPALALRALTQHERSRFRDTGGELGFGRQSTDERFSLRSLSLDVDAPSRPWLEASAGGHWQREQAKPAPFTLGAAAPPTSVRSVRAAWVSLQIADPRRHALLLVSRRWDEQFDHLRASAVAGQVVRTDITRTLDAPQIGARIRLPRGVELRANYARTERAPDFLELFGQQGSVQGNPQLASEHSDRWDVGLAGSGRLGALVWFAEGARFQNFVRQMIVFQRNGPSSVRARNVGRAALRGEEGSLTAMWRTIELSGTTAWLSALDVTDPSIYRGKRVPQRSERQWGGRLVVRRGPARLGGEVQFIGADFLDPANLTRAPSRTFVGATASVTLARLVWTIEGRNLRDQRVADVAGFPLPGRSLFVSIATVSAPPSQGEP